MKTHQISVGRVVQAVLSAVLLISAGCSGASPTDAESGVTTESERASGKFVRSIHRSDQPAQGVSIEEGRPGEAEEKNVPSDGLIDKAACNTSNMVYIEWCDHPLPGLGMVCRVRAPCRSLMNGPLLWAAEIECERDANHVCGDIVYPWVM